MASEFLLEYEEVPILSKFMNVNKFRGFANRNESLRVAYVDEVETLDKGSSYYSKLVKVDKMEKTKDQVRSISFPHVSELEVLEKSSNL